MTKDNIRSAKAEFRRMVGQQVRTARRRQEKHQTDLQRASGVDHATISEIERGVKAARAETLLALALGLGFKTMGELLLVVPEDLPEIRPSSQMPGRKVNRKKIRYMH